MTAKTARTPETERERERKRERERGEERRGEERRGEERRAEQSRGEERRGEEREREERKKGRTTYKMQTQKDSAFHGKGGESHRACNVAAPINSCFNGIRDNLRVEKESALELLCEAGPHWEQAGCE